jgi:hypothetical protein
VTVPPAVGSWITLEADLSCARAVAGASATTEAARSFKAISRTDFFILVFLIKSI